MVKKKGIILFALVLFFGAICFGSVENAIAIYPCEGDFDRDGKVLYDDLVTFAADYSRTDCPPYIPTPPAPVPETGQITCYDSDGNVIACSGTGQDGDLRKGMAWPDPRFTDNDDGTVTDNLTGLIWLKNATCAGEKTWANALTYCNTLASGSCGLTDGSIPSEWRLPNMKELLSLIDYEYYNPAFPSVHPFTGVENSPYWSSTTIPVSPHYALYLGINYGFVHDHDKDVLHYVWPVRDSIE
jgi:hypothetical protein